MKLRYLVPLLLLFNAGFVGLMITLNNRYGSVNSALPAVAGASAFRINNYAVDNEQKITDLINDQRSLNGLETVREDKRLNKIAQVRAEDMISRQYYSHTSPDNSSFVDFFSSVNIPHTTYSCENLLLTISPNETTMISEWLDSPAHRRCLLDPYMNSIGLVINSFDSDSIIVTAVFASLN